MTPNSTRPAPQAPPKISKRGAALAALLACIPSLTACATSSPPSATVSISPRVKYTGAFEPPGSERAAYQQLMLDLASVWADCDTELMKRILAPDVDFSYPSQRLKGLDMALADLAVFCNVATDRSIYFPQDAFYIDTRNSRIAAEVQFRVTQGGQKQVVNDVWIATIRDGKISVIKEYLDGRVRHLQAEGVLTYGEDAPFLTPWPPRVGEAEK
ncbi:MAG: nuclear transport factor 2 family protein [Novosphingobium sp.]